MKFQGEVVGKTKPRNFEVTADSGKQYAFKWERSEYRVYSKSGQDMKLGAIKTDNLIQYVKKNL